MEVQAIRGAIQVAENDSIAIGNATTKLVRAIMQANSIEEMDIISIQFTQTSDLDSANPATSLRTTGFQHCPLLCMQEAECKGMLERVVRVLITYRTLNGEPGIPVYLDGAEVLRKDIR